MALLSCLSSGLLNCTRSQLAKRAFESAKSQNTALSYRLFLSGHPDSKLVSEARRRLAQLEFDEAKRKNTKTAYGDFIADHPNSDLAGEATKRLAQMDFEEAEEKDSSSAYRAFVAEHPDSELAEEANRRAIAKAEREAEQGELQGYVDALRRDLAAARHSFMYTDRRSFVRGYSTRKIPVPDDPRKRLYHEEYSKQIHALLYKSYGGFNTVEDWIEYLQIYPASPHRTEVLHWIESIVLNRFSGEWLQYDLLRRYLDFARNEQDAPVTEEKKFRTPDLSFWESGSGCGVAIGV